MTNSKNRLLVLLIVVSSFIGYLEWGGGNKYFLFEMEKEVLVRFFANPTSVIHPLTILPILGQVMLFITLVKNPFNKRLAYWGIGLIGLLMLLIFFIGIIELNGKILLCTLPFLISSLIFLYTNMRRIP